MLRVQRRSHDGARHVYDVNTSLIIQIIRQNGRVVVIAPAGPLVDRFEQSRDNVRSLDEALNLPEMNGSELCSALTASGGGLPAALITGRNDFAKQRPPCTRWLAGLLSRANALGRSKVRTPKPAVCINLDRAR